MGFSISLNKINIFLRRMFFLYLTGVILACQITFFEETFFVLALPKLFKILFNALIFPFLIIIAGYFILLKEKNNDKAGFFYSFLTALILFGFWSGGYFFIGKIVAQGMYLPLLKIDEFTPFREEFVFLYLTVYPLFLLPFFVVKEKSHLIRLSLSYIAILTLSYLIFFLIPVSFPRPDINTSTFSGWTLSLVYISDPVWNCFPSTHCAVSFLASLFILEVRPNFGRWVLGSSLALCISTLLTKQHYFVDAVAGIVLSIVVYKIFLKLFSSKIITGDFGYMVK